MFGPAYVCVRQKDESDCGAAALATVLQHHGKTVSTQRLRKLTRTDRRGTDILRLKHAAKLFGFVARGGESSCDELVNEPLPVIAQIQTEPGAPGGHFVVVHAVDTDGAIVADPARGIVRLSWEELRRVYTGWILVVVPGPPGGQPLQFEMETPPSPWYRFVGLLLAQRGMLSSIFVCALMAIGLGVLPPYIVQNLVDGVLAGNEWKLLNALGIALVVILVGRTTASVLRQYYLAWVSRSIDLVVVDRYYRHLLRLPQDALDSRSAGEFLSRFNEVAKVREAIGSAAVTLVVDGLVVVTMFIVLLFTDALLTLAAMAVAPLLMLNVICHSAASTRRSRKVMEDNAALSAVLVEDFQAAKTIKVFTAAKTRTEIARTKLIRLEQSVYSWQMLAIRLGAVATLLTGLAGVVVLWYGGHHVMTGAISIGQLMLFFTLLGYLLEPLERLASINVKLQDALVAVERLYEILDEQEEEPDAENKVPFAGLKHSIELRNVSVTYGRSSNVLDNLTIHILAGKTTALVGEVGSGKSTVLLSLLRLVQVCKGQVLFDGMNINDLELESLRGRMGWVAQQPDLVSGTLFENIRLGRPEASMLEVVEAAKTAGLAEFIEQLPGKDKYQTLLGERGLNLSSGERQKIAIARALLVNPDILLLDEPTSNLDAESEVHLWARLKKLVEGKTVVVVAHRLITIRSADWIYVLDRGQVVEEGTHSELLDKGGKYAGLWRAQTGA